MKIKTQTIKDWKDKEAFRCLDLVYISDYIFLLFHLYTVPPLQSFLTLKRKALKPFQQIREKKHFSVGKHFTFRPTWSQKGWLNACWRSTGQKQTQNKAKFFWAAEKETINNKQAGLITERVRAPAARVQRAAVLQCFSGCDPQLLAEKGPKVKVASLTTERRSPAG